MRCLLYLYTVLFKFIIETEGEYTLINKSEVKKKEKHTNFNKISSDPQLLNEKKRKKTFQFHSPKPMLNQIIFKSDGTNQYT